MDTDVFLTEPDILKAMVFANLTIMAPMLDTLGEFPNFLPVPFEDSNPITKRKTKACHIVPMVHSCVLVNLKVPETANLTFTAKKWDGKTEILTTEDDFYASTKKAGSGEHIEDNRRSESNNEIYGTGIPVHICNHNHFGYVMPPSDTTIEDEYKNLANLKQLLRS